MITRRHALAAIGFGVVGLRAAPASAKATLGDDGLYQMDWYLESFLDLSEDLAGASAKGKRFAVMWGLKGCPACKRMHESYMTDPEDRDLYPRQFRDPASQSHRLARGRPISTAASARESLGRSLWHSLHADDPVLSGDRRGTGIEKRAGASGAHARAAGADRVSGDVPLRAPEGL